MRSWLTILVIGVTIAGCSTPTPSDQKRPSTDLPDPSPVEPLAIVLPIHPNLATNDALITGTLEVVGPCLFVVTADDTRLGVAWRIGTIWDPGRRVIISAPSGAEAGIGDQVNLGGGPADVTRENVDQIPWLSRPDVECLGDRFVFAGSFSRVDGN